MNEHSPIRAKGSLLERAAEHYDFGAALRGASAPPMVMPEEVVIPAAEHGPVTPNAARVPNGPDLSPLAAPRHGDSPVQMVDRARLAEDGFLIPDGPVSGISEEFRIVKRQLLAAATGAKSTPKVPNGERILICSAHPGEGKTFCAINLALSMAAEKDLEVLLVDADFAKPSILSTLGLSGGPGLMDALADPDVAIEDCIIRTDFEKLSVLPAGRQTNDDTEYLASARTRMVLDALTATNPARIIVFDSPPVLAASPASELASHVGQVVMIVRADQTSETALRDGLSLLQGCANIQLLLNGVKFSPGGRRFGTYYGQGD